MKARITSIKHAPKLGDAVPHRKNDGDVGRYVESEMARCHDINRGPGVDIPSMGVEVKTRDRTSHAHHSVGQMTVAKIKATKYENSILCEKTQQQFRVEYDPTFNEITDAGMFDFSINEIQTKLRDGYETLRQQIIAGTIGDSATSGWVVAERARNSDSYRFRITNSGAKSMIAITRTVASMRKHFSEE